MHFKYCTGVPPSSPCWLPSDTHLWVLLPLIFQLKKILSLGYLETTSSCWSLSRWHPNFPFPPPPPGSLDKFSPHISGEPSWNPTLPLTHPRQIWPWAAPSTACPDGPAYTLASSTQGQSRTRGSGVLGGEDRLPKGQSDNTQWSGLWLADVGNSANGTAYKHIL